MQEKNTPTGGNHRIGLDAPVLETDKSPRAWEIENFFKCPLVGMCLTLSEQKQLLKKAGFSKKKREPYEIHEMLVSSLESENRLSRRIDSLLNRKLGKRIEPLRRLDMEAFMTHCWTALESGDNVGAIYAVATEPGLPLLFKREVFGKIHMAMHQHGNAHFRLKRTLENQENKLADMRQRIKEIQQLNRSLQKENENLKQDRSGLKTMLEAAETEKRRLEAERGGVESRKSISRLEQENRMLKERLETLDGSLEQKEQRISALQEKNSRLSSQLEQQSASNRHFLAEVQKTTGAFLAANRCDTSCPSFDLCKKRVLIVGGITRMEALYRELIESSGGIFEYHDGYMKKGVRQLESRLKRADVVLCPVSCNSHAACSIVKNLGKKHQKPVYMLTNSSLSTVSQAIWGDQPQAVNAQITESERIRPI